MTIGILNKLFQKLFRKLGLCWQPVSEYQWISKMIALKKNSYLQNFEPFDFEIIENPKEKYTSLPIPDKRRY